MFSASFMSSIYYVIKVLLYVLSFFCLYILFWSDILYLLKSLYKRSVFRSTDREYSKLYNHIDMIFYTLRGNSKSSRVYCFFAITVLLFFVPLLLSFSSLNFMFAITISIILAALPYCILRLLLYRIRINSSYDADKVVTEISNQYKICSFNMREAIRRSVKYLSSAQFCRKHIFSLALGLDTYKSDAELKKYLDYFVFSIDTQWAKILANNIYFSISKNFNVAEGLADILKDIKNSYYAAESLKRENAESVAIVFFLAPILLIISPFLAKWLMGFSLIQFLEYQFKTPVGITLFLLIVIGYCFCFFVVFFMNRKKFDI